MLSMTNPKEMTEQRPAVIEPTPKRAGMTRAEMAGAYAALVVTLLQTLVVPLTPRFPQLFDTTASMAAWIVTATLLTGAIATPILSRLADMVGKRRIILVSLALVLVGSLIAPFGGIVGIIVGRSLQGIGTAIIPVTMALMRDHVPHERLRPALALISAMLGIGGGLGIPLGGVIMKLAGWQSIFWLSAIMTALAIVAIVRAIEPEERTVHGGSFDLRGAVVLSIGLTTFLVGMSKAGEWGFASPLTISLILIGLAVLGLWTLLQSRTKHPLMSMRTAFERPIFMVNVAALLLGFTMFMNLLVTTVQLQNLRVEHGFELGPQAAGLAMLPSAIISGLMAPVSARIAERFSPRVLLVLGSLIVATGYLLRWGMSPNVGMVIFWATFLTVGISLGYSALPMIVVHHVDRADTASANGLNALLRSIGMTLGSTFVGMVGVLLAVEHAGHAGPSWNANVAVFLTGAVAGLIAAAAAFLTETRHEKK